MADYPWENVTPVQQRRSGFNAKYDGMCGAGDVICAGEEIRSYAGEYWHVDCAAEDEAVVPREAADDPDYCAKCWTVHRGECP